MYTGERQFSCDICPKQFWQKGHLSEHMKLHGDKHYYGCETCGETFKQSYGLRNHKARCHAMEWPKRRTGRPRKSKPETDGSELEGSVNNGEESQQQTVDIDVESLHKCKFCEETFPTIARLDNHIAWHATRKRFKCLVCNRVFKHLSIFRKHQALHAKRQKNDQEQPTVIPDEAQDPGTNEATAAPFCEECQKPFSCRFSLTRHMNEYHQGRKRARAINQINLIKKRHTCFICFKTFANIYSLKVHTERVHPLKTHKCDICNKTYGILNDLKYHYKNYHIRLAYACDACGKPFNSKSKLKKHKKEHSNPKQLKRSAGRKQQDAKIEESNRPHECDICGKGFQFPSRLKEHFLIHKQLTGPTSQCPYKCEVCQRVFQYPSRLREHLKCHESATEQQAVCINVAQSGQPYCCDVCGKSFRFVSLLKRHKKTHYHQEQVLSSHQRNPPHGRHICSVCGKRFEFESFLKRHETSYHRQKVLNTKSLSKEPFECNVCDRKFQYSSQLRLHSITHNKEKTELEQPSRKRQKCASSTSMSEVACHEPQQDGTFIARNTKDCYECDICGNTFSDEAFLRSHYTVHEQDPKNKSYFCIYCNRSFWQSNHLKNHCRLQHKTDKVFQCETCLVIFKKDMQLREHQRTCTKEKSSDNAMLALIESQHVNKRTKRSVVEVPTNNSASQSTEKSGKRVTKPSKKAGLPPAKIPTKKSNKKRPTFTTRKSIPPTCHFCGSTFCTNGALRVHLNIHFDRRPFSCRFCGMKFRQGGHLSAHCRMVHHEEFPYLCDLCEASFKGLLLLKRHQADAHGVTENPNEVNGFEKPVSPAYNDVDFEPEQYTRIANFNQTLTEYICGLCDSSSRTFKSLSGLRRHITVVHTNSGHNAGPREAWDPRWVVTVPREDSPVNPAPSEEIYKCNVCSVIVHGSEALEAHEKAHAKKFLDGPSSSPSMLSTPSPPTIAIKQIFECKYCEMEFDSMSREAFDQHQLEHELAAEEPMGMAYICAECDKEFTMPGDLIKHHEEAH